MVNKVQKPITTTRVVTLEALRGAATSAGRLGGASSSQAFFLHPLLKGNLAEDDGEQSICRRCQPNSLAISNDNEELFPISCHLGRTSLLIK
jgi:hypothetical protein